MYLLKFSEDPNNSIFKEVAQCVIDKSKPESEIEEIIFYLEILKTRFIPDMNSFIEMKGKLPEMDSEERLLYSFLFDTYPKLKNFFESNPEDASPLIAKYIREIPFLFEYARLAVIDFINFFPSEGIKYSKKFISNINENDNWAFYCLLQKLNEDLLSMETKEDTDEFLFFVRRLLMSMKERCASIKSETDK